ncbi:MAG: ATP synthase F0 subunit B [Deltaproteobacteria bacterium]
MISLNLTIFIQMGLFLVLMLILNRLVFRPMVSLLEEREKRVKDPGADAKGMEAEVERMRLQYEATLNDAKLKAIEERNGLRKEGADREQEIIKNAYKASEETLSDVKGKIEKELDIAREALRKEAAFLSSNVAEKLLGRPV